MMYACVSQVASNNALLQLAVRPTASPIELSVQAFLVDKHSLARDGRGLGCPQEHQGMYTSSPIGVKYQGFRNGDVWWNPAFNGSLGVVTRRMVKQARQCDYVGCQYSLVRKMQGWC
jgi:hypothetical protein